MKKKVYITSLHLQHGGIEMAITLLANALEKRGYDVEILCTYDLGEPAYELNENIHVKYLTNVRPNKKEIREAIHNKNIIQLFKQGFYAVKVLYLKKRTMEEEIKSIQDGCIIATRNDHAVILSKYGAPGVKKVAQLHHDHQFKKNLLKDFRDNYMNIDEFVLLTESLKEEVQEIMSKNKHTKFTVIPNFLLDLNSEVVEKKKKQVVAVGRFHSVKGFSRMLEIWAHTNVDSDVVLKIIGDGDEFEQIKNKIKELRLENSVVLTGALEHTKVMEEMRKSLVYLMTSFTEAFPFVLIEAMSAGLPIVAFDVRVGPRAMIEEGKNGYLIEDGNLEQFAKCLEELITNEEKRKEMSANALDIVQRFSEEHVMEKWIRLLEEHFA